LVLEALAIISALGFLVLVMVQAMAFYATPSKPTKPNPRRLDAATRSAPVEPKEPKGRAYLGATKSLTVIPPRPLVQPSEPEHRALLPATKAGILGPLKVTPPAPAPQPQDAPAPRSPGSP